MRRLTNQVREVEVEKRVETVAAAAVAALLVVEILGYFGCADAEADCGGECGECCPKHPTATTCDAPMSLMGNISQLVISIYMIPLGILIILYEISTKRAGAQEVRPLCRCLHAAATFGSSQGQRA